MQGISLHHLHLPIQNNKNRWERVSVKASKGSEEGDKALLLSISDILEASRAQKVEVQLKTLGPFFRITATSLETQRELGRAEGLIRIWFPGTKILHLHSMKLRKETLNMEKSIFGLGSSSVPWLFVTATIPGAPPLSYSPSMIPIFTILR
ncbi:hypothetical protein PIB30_062469 [Stylosanthes scabra]|uniref:Uncharacterized protein n=1 Tax=Stylosanthes scabra TaxID=79078 RepID=A0ABU6XLC3_9FABA|nr:hypothetical protein [Stylosanthes scabra]